MASPSGPLGDARSLILLILPSPLPVPGLPRSLPTAYHLPPHRPPLPPPSHRTNHRPCIRHGPRPGQDIFRKALHGQDVFWRCLYETPERARLDAAQFAESAPQLQQDFSEKVLSESQLPPILPPAPNRRAGWQIRGENPCHDRSRDG
jgi:hypothetical protein